MDFWKLKVIDKQGFQPQTIINNCHQVDLQKLINFCGFLDLFEGTVVCFDYSLKRLP